MKRCFRVVLSTLFAISLFGCEKKVAETGAAGVKSTDLNRRNEREALVGRYGLRSGGKTVPFVRVLHPEASQEFVMKEWGAGDWQGATTVGRALTAVETKKLQAAGLPDSTIALSFGTMILVKVSKGDATTVGGSRGFAILSEIGPIELTPM